MKNRKDEEVKREAARMNSWHWLAVGAVAAALVSVFMPEHGWRDAVANFRDRQQPRIAAAQRELEDLKRLTVHDVEESLRQTGRLKKRHAAMKAVFDAMCFDELPRGEKAVFDAQAKVAEAMAAHKIAIVSSGAKVNGNIAAADAKAAQTAKAPQRRLTAAEFRRESEAAAAQMKDRALREMFLADAKRKIAQMEAAEKKAAAAPKPGETAAPKPAASRARKGFKSIDIDYMASGDFRGIFMFFVAETRKRPCYSFKDIRVAKSGDEMALEFTLQVDYK